MRFEMAEAAFYIDPGEIGFMMFSDLRGCMKLSFLIDGIKPAYPQECLPRTQAKGLLSNLGDIKRI